MHGNTLLSDCPPPWGLMHICVVSSHQSTTFIATETRVIDFICHASDSWAHGLLIYFLLCFTE